MNVLFPQTNPFRQMQDLSGIWELRFDAQESGEAAGWAAGFTGGRPVAVPASWNDQFMDAREVFGPAWYQTTFARPWGWEDRRVWLRFGSVNYLARVWLNGVLLGAHEGGHLPFALEVTGQLHPEANLLVVRVDGRLTADSVPAGNVPLALAEATVAFNYYPAATFDFFPFCGIHRPVTLVATPLTALQDITVTTALRGSTGIVRVQTTSVGDGALHPRIRLAGHGREFASAVTLDDAGTLELEVPEAALWQPGSPHRYDLTVELLEGSTPRDRYTLPIGIRTVAIAGDQLLLNGRPIMLRGFGRHEDFPVIGRGAAPAVMVKDMALLEWIGANSFRTTHYPYAEETMELADRLGYLVIAETPAVGMYLHEAGAEHRLDLCRHYVEQLIARDKNHPSVIMWSLANEPRSAVPEAAPFFRNLYDLAKSLDATRPVTIVSRYGLEEESFDFCDVVCVNRYFGWYTDSGQIDVGVAHLSAELDDLHARYPKPVLLSEFGADTLAGWHAEPGEMFSEEYQADLLEANIAMLHQKPYLIGYHVWNLCDFKTGQGIIRVGALNLKGVFTRDRRPKLAAHRLRARWKTSS